MAATLYHHRPPSSGGSGDLWSTVQCRAEPGGCSRGCCGCGCKTDEVAWVLVHVEAIHEASTEEAAEPQGLHQVSPVRMWEGCVCVDVP